MIINRQNYEEYFVQYVDDELTAEERCQVEAFVMQNSDLATEFNQLQQATLQPDPAIKFNHKDLLFKTGRGIDSDNYETYFLLYVDNELNRNEKEAVERFVLQHPQLQQQFIVLQQVKLAPEEITFSNKEVLYRKERKPVALMPWLKMMAAALIAGIVLTLYITIPSEKPATGIKQNLTQFKPHENDGNNRSPVSAPNNTEHIKLAAPIAATKENAIAKAQPANGQKNQNKPENRALKQNDITQVAVTNKSAVDRLPQPDQANLIATVGGSKKNEDGNEIAAIAPDLFSSPKNSITNNLQDKPGRNETIVQQALYKEIDTEADVRENSILFGNTRINKNKLRGLFKKAGSLFNKKEDRNDTDKTIQIASFEIKG